MKITAIQMNSVSDKKMNLDTARHLLESAIAQDHPDVLALPEMFSFIGGNQALRLENAEDFSNPAPDSAFLFLKNFAKQHNVFIHGGSICEKVGDQHFNTTPVFNRSGELISYYRKIHLFCADLKGQIFYREKDFYSSGKHVVLYDADDCKIGSTICYDIRFPELYECLRKKGSDVIMVPSAFLDCTGRDHWKVLCQARAIETQCYIVAPNQTGCYTINGEQRALCSHTLIVDPWGKVLGEIDRENGFITAEIDRDYLAKVRNALPVARSREIREKVDFAV